MFGLLGPRQVKGWQGSPRLLHISRQRARAVATTVHVAAGSLLIACAVAILVAPSAPGLWRPLAIGAGVVSLCAFATFWDGQIGKAADEGALGLMASLALLGCAVALPGAFT